MLITEGEDIKLLLGVDWIWEVIGTMRLIQKSTTPTDQSERNEVFTQFEKLVKKSQTIKDTEIKIFLKSGHISMKQKARIIPYRLQKLCRKRNQ